ncbi:hypothetical protein BpHYR1_052017 [Brachionus plicatilis]|uniref:Uncharacterized protein n=1 Tax=Brachionus plicatilis TaxID=10195 RepID=A0A3M7PKS2_BRAPC|nr:hypothetical protein BpHYR1_052017 [Brachionus plicatilis]
MTFITISDGPPTAAAVLCRVYCNLSGGLLDLFGRTAVGGCPTAIQLESAANCISRVNYVKTNIFKNRKLYLIKTINHMILHVLYFREILKKINSLKIFLDSEEKIYKVSCLSKNINRIPSTTVATHPIKNHMIAAQNNIDILACENKIKTATGIITHASGKTKPIEIKLGNSLFLIEFIVFDHEDHDDLLGLDWFQKTNSGIFPSHGLKKFPGSDFKLENSENNKEENIFDIFLSDVNAETSDDYFWENKSCKVTQLGSCEVYKHKLEILTMLAHLLFRWKGYKVFSENIKEDDY